jgi:hypothetical protein
MMGFLRRRGPTAIAVTLAFLAGGGAAVTAQNLITGADIKDGSIKSADIGDGAVTKADLANNAVNSAKIVDGQVGKADLGNNAVNSAKIVDGQVKSADLANGSVNSAKIVDGQVGKGDLGSNSVNSAKIVDGQVLTADIGNNAVNSAKIADGSIAAADISAAAQDALTAYSGGNWSVLHRNVIGNGDTELQPGPSFVQVGDPPDAEVVLTPAPAGIGSLGIRTGAGTDKAAFGDALDFLGDPVANLTAVSFFVYTTGEKIAVSPINVPNISIEILANLEPDAGDFTTMVYEPSAQAPGWQENDAAADPDAHWRLTGAEGTTTGCNQTTSCTFAQLKAALDDGGAQAVIGTVGISKGSDFAFSGAVDALRINNTVYDFEPNGVFESPAAP